MAVQKAEKGFQEVWKLFEESSRQFKETREMFKEAEKRSKEADRRSEEAEKRSKELDKKIEALTGKWSKFVEGLIAPAAEKLFKKCGIEVDTIYQRVRKHKNGKQIEIDILAINGEYAVLIEAKSTLGVGDVNEHIKRLKKFKGFFPEYRDRKVVGAVAGIVIEEGADKYAYNNGMYVIGQSGETVRILNDRRFKPKVW
ncbi:MAG: DUF3782 domain-containing protein [Candidatus Hydrothermarchaeales archaeon]